MYDLPRFSTDLDFDILKETPHFMQEMEKVLQQFGTIKDKKNKKFTYFFLVSYWTGEHTIKIEISKKIYKNTDYELVNFFGTSIRAMSKDSIFAHKLVALSERYKNRDLFDVHFFFKNNFPINEDIIKERTWKTLKKFLLELKKNIPLYYNKNTILAEIWDLITEKQKYFIKTKIVDEVVWMITFMLFTIENPL